MASNVAISTVRHYIRPRNSHSGVYYDYCGECDNCGFADECFFHDLYVILGIFIPLIVTNCAVLGRAEAFASKHSPSEAALDSFMMGLGFTFVLITLGGLREVIANGTLFSQAHLMFGESAKP